VFKETLPRGLGLNGNLSNLNLHGPSSVYCIMSRTPRWVLPVLLLPCLASCEVRRLERLGFSKCDEGLRIVRACPVLSRPPITTEEGDRALSELRRAKELITEGLALLEKAQEKSGGKRLYDTTPYLEALKVVRMKIMELK